MYEPLSLAGKAYDTRFLPPSFQATGRGSQGLALLHLEEAPLLTPVHLLEALRLLHPALRPSPVTLTGSIKGGGKKRLTDSVLTPK